MNPQRDIERTLDRWFAPGPDRVPERVVERALANIEHIDQRRARSASGRFIKMPANLRLLAAAAVLTVAGGLAYLVVGSNRPSAAAPTPVLGRSGAAATWSATRPAVFGRPAGTFEFDTYENLVGRSTDGVDFPLGTVVADSGTATVGATVLCKEKGTYRYQHSGDYLKLVVEAVSDPCTDRRTFIEGEWLRVRSETDLEIGHAYTIDMGVGIEFAVPAWPDIPGPGPYVVTDGAAGEAPRELRVGTDVPGQSVSMYEFRLVVDPRIANDVCDIARGSLGADWTLDDFAARTAPESATFSPPTRTTVSGFPAVMIDVVGSASCYNDQFTEDQCCPDDVFGPSSGGRLWAVDLDQHKILMSFMGNGRGVTAGQLAVGSDLVASLRLTPPPE